MKKIENLVTDIYATIENVGGGLVTPNGQLNFNSMGWNSAISKYFGEEMAKIADEKITNRKERNHLSLSMLGGTCPTETWYKVNRPDLAEPLDAEALGTFFYGDMLEILVLALARASGHKVEGEQTECNLYGVPGRKDVVIDGVIIDAKSASNYGFKKFEDNALKTDDPFGYISQLSSYLAAAQDDPMVEDKNGAAFLAIRKERFKLCLDYYDLTKEMKNKKKEIEAAKALVAGPKPSYRVPPVKQYKDSKNTKLAFKCQYCSFKRDCWPEMRTFQYAEPTGLQYLIDVVTEPRVPEIK